LLTKAALACPRYDPEPGVPSSRDHRFKPAENGGGIRTSPSVIALFMSDSLASLRAKTNGEAEGDAPHDPRRLAGNGVSRKA
jgi:hypothetical protein